MSNKTAEHPRRRAMRERRLWSHPIPCNLVKTADGVWVESPWFVNVNVKG